MVIDEEVLEVALEYLWQWLGEAAWPADRVLPEQGRVLVLGDDGVLAMAWPCAASALQVAVADLVHGEVRSAVRSRLVAEAPAGPGRRRRRSSATMRTCWRLLRWSACSHHRGSSPACAAP
jgi:hypothetical protein